jgi:hypothetical protein
LLAIAKDVPVTERWISMDTAIELELPASLPRLRHLYLGQLRGDVDFDAVARRRGLRHLAVSFPTRHEATRMTGRLRDLPELEYLHLSLDPSPVRIDLACVPANPNLRDLHLIGFVPSTGRYDELEQATQLQGLTVTTHDEARLERLADKLAPIDLQGPTSVNRVTCTGSGCASIASDVLGAHPTALA